MNNLRSKILGILVFLFIFSFIFYISSSLVILKREGRYGSTSRIKSFYALENNTIDVLFIGASSFRNGVSPFLMWNEKGITSFVRATSNQSPIVSYYYLRESLRKINPRIVALDGLMLTQEFDYDNEEPSLRLSIDPLPLSAEKIELILKIHELSKEQTIVSYLFPFFRYHTRWMKTTPADFKDLFQNNIPEIYRGQYVDYEIIPQAYPENYMEKVDSGDEIAPSSREYYEKIIKLCHDNGIKLAIVSLPRLNSYNYTIHQKLKQFAEEHEILFLDYSFPESIQKMNIRLNTDFADPNHLNIWGAMKISKFIADDLSQAFNLENKKIDKNFNNWNKDFDTFISDIKKNEERLKQEGLFSKDY